MLDIVIVNWNAEEFLHKCLKSITLAVDGIETRIIVVDNDSKDNSLLTIKDYQHTLIRNSNNLGFSAACNKGAAIGSGKFILFLNPDMVLNSGSIKYPLEFLSAKDNFDIAVVGIRMIDEFGKTTTSIANFPRFLDHIIEILQLSKFFPRVFNGRMIKAQDANADQFADEINGAYLMIRRSVFENINGFDERFFMYCDELDLCKRVMDSGYKLYYLSKYYAIHFGHGCSRIIPVTRALYSLNSKIKYIKKHNNIIEIFLLSILILIFGYGLKIPFIFLKNQIRKIMELLTIKFN
jgi:GT2 family glycosyltransferase